MLQSLRSQTVRHNLATEQQQPAQEALPANGQLLPEWSAVPNQSLACLGRSVPPPPMPLPGKPLTRCIRISGERPLTSPDWPPPQRTGTARTYTCSF